MMLEILPTRFEPIFKKCARPLWSYVDCTLIRRQSWLSRRSRHRWRYRGWNFSKKSQHPCWRWSRCICFGGWWRNWSWSGEMKIWLAGSIVLLICVDSFLFFLILLVDWILFGGVLKKVFVLFSHQWDVLLAWIGVCTSCRYTRALVRLFYYKIGEKRSVWEQLTVRNSQLGAQEVTQRSSYL